MVVEYYLALVVCPVPITITSHQSSKLRQNKSDKPGLEDFAEQLGSLALRDLLLAVHEEEVAVVVEAGVVEGGPDSLTVCPGGCSLPLEQSWRSRLELSPGFIVILKCGLKEGMFVTVEAQLVRVVSAVVGEVTLLLLLYTGLNQVSKY